MHTSSELSVVIPAYNHAGWIAQALASVGAQSLGPADVILVDDGSTDQTAEIAERTGLPGLTVIRQPNAGAHAALNRAIEAAKGSWVGILNSDDLYRPDHLEHALGVARATRAALVVGRVSLVDATGSLLQPDHPMALWYGEALENLTQSDGLATALMKHNAAVTTSTFLLHRALWRRLGGFRPYRYVHDLDFLLRALALVPERVVFEPTLAGVAYRVHGRNTITEDVATAFDERRRMLRAQRRWGVRIASLLRREPARRALRAALDQPFPRSRIREGGDRAGRALGSVRCGLVAPALSAGGLEEVVALLAMEFPALGIEPHVLCTQRGGAVADRLVRAGVPVSVAPDRDSRMAWLRSVRPQVLSTHFVSAEALADLCAGGLPAVETVHNTYAWFSEQDWTAERDKRRWLRAVVAVSETAGAYYARHTDPTVPLHVIPNGVVPGRVCQVARTFARRVLGLPPEALILTQLGRMVPEKNQVDLVSAFREVAAHHPGAVLLLAGPHSDAAYAEVVRREASALIAQGRVRLMPSRPDVGVLLSAADVFVANSWFEGWSLSATESLWVGTPIVVSDCGGSRELVGNAEERGRVVPNPVGDPLEVNPDRLRHPDTAACSRNRAALVQALLEVLADLPDWVERRADIRAHARAHYSAAAVARRNADLLRSLAR